LPEVDWDSIWATGDGAESEQRSIGRVVTAAFIAARDVADHLSSVSDTRRIFTTKPIRSVNLVVPPELSRPVEEMPRASVGVTDESASMVRTAEVMLPWLDTPERVAPSPLDVDDLPSEHIRLPGMGLEREPSKVAGDTVPRGATIFTWIRNIGVIILLFVAWQLWGTSIGQHQAQQNLRSQFESSVRAHGSGATSNALIPPGTVVPVPAEGTAIAHLQIPSIGVDQFVVSGTSADDLSKGPGHYIGTAMPGQAGNVAIAGHRTTNGAPFNQLGHMALGDKIILTTLLGEKLTYVVSQAPVAVSPSDVSVVNDFGDNRITLTTCTPEFSAAQRLVVVGELQQGVANPTSKTKPVTYHVVNAQISGWVWHLLPVVALEVAALVLLALSNRRLLVLFGRFGHWLILLPIWIAGLYLLFETLTTFLPASF
jgi:sortase A